MTTNLQIIEDALRDINVISEVDNASPEQGKYCLRRLNQMMDVWREESKDVGYFSQTDTNADCPIPDWSKLGVTTTLAVAIAPKFGASVSGELVAVGSSAMELIERKVMLEKMKGADMTHLPYGHGHLGTRYDISTDN